MKDKILDDAEDLLNSGIPKAEKKVFLELKELLRQFNTSGGKIVFDSQTINLINEAEKRILKALNKSGYNDRVKSYLKDFDLIKENVVAQQKKINGINVATRPLNNLQKSAIQQTTNILTGNGMNYNFIQPVKDILLSSASSGMTIAEAELQLKSIVLGDEERLGKLNRYVTQVSRDAVSQFDGMLQSRIAKEYDLDGISYEGSIIRDSRDQCKRWVEMGEIPWENLEAEVAWAFKYGSGMIPETTKDNFIIYRGGYNCRHSATAIRLSKEPNSELTKLLEGAKEAKDEMQEITEIIIDKYDAGATNILFKSRGSAIRKAVTEYDGDYNKITDLIRNTVFTENKKNISSIIEDVKSESKKFGVEIIKVKQRSATSDPLGYSGNLLIGKTANGTSFETQINTAKMIYAKEKPEDAIRIIGKSKWDEIKKETGLQGGLGHEYYEKFRLLNPDSREALIIAEQSKKYYANFLD